MNNRLKHRSRFNRMYVILILLMMIGVGYALNPTTLNISGNTKINKSWNLVLENLKKTDDSIAVTFSDTTLDNSNGIFSLTIGNAEFSSLEDYIEFQFDIVNNGDMDVSLKDFNIIINEEIVRKYFKTVITYNDGKELNIKDKILKGERKTFIAKIILDNENPEVNLADVLEYNPTDENKSITYNFNITYEQA